jgi:DNA-binding NtrC family response regulator
MALLPSSEWRVAEAIAGITTCNPFLPERLELERKALGDDYVDVGPVLRTRPGMSLEEVFPNIPAFRARSEQRAEKIRQRLEDGHRATRDELVVYENLALYFLYARYMSAFDGLVSKTLEKTTWTVPVPYWREFKNDFDRFLRIPGQDLPSKHIPEVLFAGFFQIERAFTHIFQKIVGGSMPVAKLRAAVWESIFTHDMRRYTRSLHRTMADVPTLVTGPSGSGKELVARAIGLSCFVPFDPGTRRFVAGGTEMYVPLNLSALAPTLIESELFGHVKGAFTTAHKDREGWLERCGEHGAVFLDEIGELDAAIQVKLLRVLEARTFQRVGSTDTLPFKGKIIAATNRDLAAEMQAGRFRHDLYYRLCADQVETPSLAEQLADRPEDLTELVRFIAREVLGKRADDPNGLALGAEANDGFTEEVERLTAEVVAWIDRELSRSYAWPGNFRELGQCVRNVMIRGSYRPPSATRNRVGVLGPVEELLRQVRGVEVTRDEFLGRYYALAYDRSGGSYTAAGRRLGVDWRVVKSRLDQPFLKRLRCPRNAEER